MANINNLNPEARKKLLGAFADLDRQGIPYRVNSAYRSPEEQKKLYANRKNNPYPVAKPGTSRHEKGLAADLGIAPEHREAANAVLAKHGWSWAGPKDEVHYDFGGGKGTTKERLAKINAGIAPALKDYQATVAAAIPNGSDAAQFMSAGPRVPQGSDAGNFLSSGPQIPQGSDAANFFGRPPEAAPDNRNLFQRGIDYTKDYFHNVFGASGRPINERVAYAGKPLMDLGNLATGGTLGTALQRTVAPALAGVSQIAKIGNETLVDLMARQMLSAEHLPILLQYDEIEKKMRRGQKISFYELEFMRDNKFIVEAARQSGVSGSPESRREAVITSMIRAYKGEPDPSLPRGGIGAAAFGYDNPMTQTISAYYDAWLGGMFLKGAGKAAGKAIASRPGQFATTPIRAVAGKANQALLASRLSVPYQRMFNIGKEFRSGQQVLTEETAAVRAGTARLNRIHTQILNYSAKLRQAGVETVGNFLEGHEGGRFVRSLQKKGDLVDQAVEMYAEAGPGPDSFFQSKEAVLAHAAKLGLDPQMVMKLGEEASSLMYNSGEQMVKAGLMDAKTFAANAGEYTRRFYRLGNVSSEEARAMLMEMADAGELDTRTASILQSIAMHGDDSGSFSRKQGIDPHKVVRERQLLNADERADYAPELSFIKSSSRSLTGQLKASAAARAMARFADPNEGISAVTRLMNEDFIRPPTKEQPRYMAELSRIKSQIKAMADRASRPETGLTAELATLEGRLAKAQATTQHYGQKRAQLQIAEPVQPIAPTPKGPPSPTASIDFKPSFLDTAEVRVARKFAAEQLTTGARRVGGVINRMAQRRELVKYAEDLKAWQKEHDAWKKKFDVASTQFDVETARLQRSMVELDQHQQLIDRHNAEVAAATRRQSLLEGAPATVEHADDALQSALQKVDPEGKFPMTPEVQAYWHQKWIETWNTKNYDIFGDIPPTGLPSLPKGFPEEIADAMGRNNPLIAIALDESLSMAVPEGVRLDQLPPGWEPWGPEYGAMAGRAAPTALKHFVDDMINPDRLGRDQRIVPLLKWAGEQIRFLKLYTNIPTHASIYIQSWLEGYATVADAGGVFNPISYRQGMKEWGQWLKGGPETPTVKAILDSGVDMGGSFRTSVDPATAKPMLPGEQNPVSRLRDYARRKFVDVQVFPKAGVTKILIDQGMDPKQAAQWAEKGYGGVGVVQGGIETPGLMKLLEIANSYGVAMFTSYPVHSLNRVMQLMVTNPQLAIQFPMLRKYLIDQAGTEFAAMEEQKDLRPTEVPIPTDTIIGKLIANPDGSPGVIDIANLIPHGGAFTPFDPPNLLESFILYDAERKKMQTRQAGLNPIDREALEGASLIKHLSPGGISKAIMFNKALKGENPSPYASQPQSPLQASLGFVGLPMREVVQTAERLLDDSRRIEKPERLKFMIDLERRMLQGYSDGLPDLRNHPKVKTLDPVETDLASRAAQTELMRMLADSSISDDKAKTMIRNQIGYLNSLMARADELGVRLSVLELGAGE